MIKIGDKVYRNLEEQVEYLTHYHDVNQGLAQWGIRVVGQVETADELPDPATYEGEYGDAIAVGDKAPFSFYIWTRASIEGEPDHWFPFGEISIVGPQGPKGDKGDTGEDGKASKWYTHTNILPEDPDFKEGDMLLTTGSSLAGNVYIYSEAAVAGRKWQYITNILGPKGNQGVQGPKGEQGIQGETGPQGPTGDPGAFIHIEGILTAYGQLPTPESINDLSIAYLVGTSSPYDLYMQIGPNSAEAIWTNMGPLNVATLVTVGGAYQNTWNADTKLDKYTVWDNKTTAYVKHPTGTQGNKEISGNATGGTIAERTVSGELLVGANPTSTNAATPKGYVDSIPVIKQSAADTASTEKKLYLYATPDKSDQAKKIIAPGSIRILATDNSASTDFTPSQIVNIIGGNAKFFDYPAASGTLATLGDIAAAANIKFLRQEISANGAVNLLPNSLYMISVSGNNLNLVDGSTNLLSSGAQFMICFCADLGTAGEGKFAVMGMTYGGGLSINTFTIVATNGTTKIKNNNTSSTAGYNVMTKQ